MNGSKQRAGLSPVLGTLVGIGSVLAFHVVQLVLYFFLSTPADPLPHSFWILIGFGGIQLLYVLPLSICLRKQRVMFWGVMATALVTLVANGIVLLLIFGGSGSLVP